MHGVMASYDDMAACPDIVATYFISDSTLAAIERNGMRSTTFTRDEHGLLRSAAFLT